MMRTLSYSQRTQTNPIILSHWRIPKTRNHPTPNSGGLGIDNGTTTVVLVVLVASWEKMTQLIRILPLSTSPITLAVMRAVVVNATWCQKLWPFVLLLLVCCDCGCGCCTNTCVDLVCQLMIKRPIHIVGNNKDSCCLGFWRVTIVQIMMILINLRNRSKKHKCVLHCPRWDRGRKSTIES